jgi:serine/threonine-protein kinase
LDENPTKTREGSAPAPDKRDVHGLIGVDLDGRVMVQSVVGAGGMGVVYRGYQERVDRHVAIKVLLPEKSDENTIRRFRNEARAASRLHHPNTITIHDFGNYGDLLYIIMEYLEGQSLQEVLDKDTRVEPARALKIMSQVLGSLQEAHDAGIIHRDIKPDNIYLKTVGKESDFVKVLDFGVAKLGEEVGGSHTLTKAGMIFGTPKYMSPEQATAKGLSPAADLYACGVVLYECLCGRPPFTATDPVSILIQHVHDPPPPFSEAAPQLGLPPELEAICQRALAKKAEGRFSTAVEMRQAIDACLYQLQGAVVSTGDMPQMGFGGQPGQQPLPTQPLGPPPSTPAPADSWSGLGVGSPEALPEAPPEYVAQPSGGRGVLIAVIIVGFILLGAVGYLVYLEVMKDQTDGGPADAEARISDTETAAEDAGGTGPVANADTGAQQNTEAPPDEVDADGGVASEEDAAVEEDTGTIASADTGPGPEEEDTGAATPPPEEDAGPVVTADTAEAPPPEEDAGAEEEPTQVAEANLVRVRFSTDPSGVRIRVRDREYERDGRYYVFDLDEGTEIDFDASADHYQGRRYRDVEIDDPDDEGVVTVRVRLREDPCDPPSGLPDPFADCN